MKINLIRLYKTTIAAFGVISILIITGSLFFSAVYWAGDKESVLFLLSGLIAGILCFLFPIFLNYKQLTCSMIDTEKCSSYSLFRKKLCEVAFSEKVFYSEFYVRFAYSVPLKFIAISNEPFSCQKGFYGSFDRSKIIILPYDDQLTQYINLNGWSKVD